MKYILLYEPSYFASDEDMRTVGPFPSLEDALVWQDDHEYANVTFRGVVPLDSTRDRRFQRR